MLLAIAPAVGLPDATILFTHARFARMLAGIAREQFRQRVGGGLIDELHVFPLFDPPRYAAITAGSFCTAAGVPSAIFRPRSRTTTWSEISITTPMSCSIRTTVTPRSWFTSST